LNGHTHIGPYSKKGLDFDRMKMTFPSQYDVGVDMNDFEPISFHELKDKIDFQIDNNVNMMHWI
jgi:calcineurin-like phosphoesterase family protein